MTTKKKSADKSQGRKKSAVMKPPAAGDMAKPKAGKTVRDGLPDRAMDKLSDNATAGRPCSFTPEIGEEICQRLIQIGSLRKVCEQDGMPDKATVFRWLLKAEGDSADPMFVLFRDQYTRARELSKDYKFDEHWEDLEQTAMVPVIIDEVPLVVDGQVVKMVTPQSVQLARLKHDAFKWQASKENPKKYGDKIDLNHSGKMTLEQLIAGRANGE